MKRPYLASIVCSLLLSMLLASCGGDSSVTDQPPAPATAATITLSTSVSGTIPATTTINSYVVTVELPDGVTVKTAPSSSVTDAGVVVPSGNAAGAFASGIYTAATGSVPASVRIYVASANGFDAGEFCVVTAEIAAGSSPTPASFPTPTLIDATGFDTVTTSTVLGLENELAVSAAAVLR